MVKNKQCLACREKFSYCPDCSRVDALKPTWASEFCSESCATLWTTLTKFGMSMLDKSEAQEIISSLNLKPIDAYVECVKRDYNKVFEPEKKPRKTRKPEPIIVELEAEIKEIFEDKAVVETCLKGSENKQTHEVVLEEKE